MSEAKLAFTHEELGISPNPNPVAQFDDTFDLYDYCGQNVGRHFNATKGQIEEFIVYCNDYTGCDKCRKRRYKYIYGRILEAYHLCLEDYEDLCIAFVNGEQAKGLTRFLGRENVFRIPQGEDRYIVFCRALGTVYENQPVIFIEKDTIHYMITIVEHVSLLDRLLSTINYPRLQTLRALADKCSMPTIYERPKATTRATISIGDIVKQISPGHKAPKMSGNLGKVKQPKRRKVEAQVGDWKVTTTQYLVAMPAKEETAIYLSARDELGPPHTDSLKELQQSVDLYCMLVRSKLEETGYPFTETIETKQPVILENVRW